MDYLQIIINGCIVLSTFVLTTQKFDLFFYNKKDFLEKVNKLKDEIFAETEYLHRKSVEDLINIFFSNDPNIKEPNASLKNPSTQYLLKNFKFSSRYTELSMLVDRHGELLFQHYIFGVGFPTLTTVIQYVITQKIFTNIDNQILYWTVSAYILQIILYIIPIYKLHKISKKIDSYGKEILS